MKTNNRMYLMTLFAVLTATIVGFLQLADFNFVSAKHAAQNDAVRATPEMLAFALTHETEDLAERFNIINQLPCETIESSDLGGKTIGAGVYCLAAARIAGELRFDAAGDASAIFVVRVDGSLTSEADSRITLLNGAQAANIHFIADSASIGANTELKGSVLANKQIQIGAGATFKGRIQSVSNAGQERGFDAAEGAGTGTLEICKALDPSSVDISNRIFNFTVTGVVGTVGTAENPIRVPAGACSSPVEVLAGTQTVTELNSGTFTNQTGNFAGGFQLNRVETITTNSPSTLGVVNRATRQAIVNIVEGTPQQELTLRFVNQFAITGFVEICKRAAFVPTADGSGFTSNPDPDVNGFFTFTIEGVFTQNQQNPNQQTLQQFVVPVGYCTNAIAVTIANPAPVGMPRESTVRVTELGKTGAFLESVSTIPADRKVGETIFDAGVDAAGGTFANAGGGYAVVRVIEGGSPVNETLINFFNRSNPGFVKICKIAGPSIPVNTPFNFRVTGLAQTGTQPISFTEVTGNVTVLAGPADQGSCQIVPGADGGIQRFVIGTRVLAVETGPLTIDGFQVRTSRVRSSTGVFSPIEFPNGNPNPDLEPTDSRISRAAIVARSEVIMFEFTNFLFRPATLKICKIAGSPTLLDQPFIFDIALVSPTGVGGDLFPAASTSLTVTAGLAANGGNCAVVNGANFLGGSLNAGSTVTITERASNGSRLTAVSSSTSPTSPTNGISANLAARTATLTGANGLRGDVTINIATFTNVSSNPPVTLARSFDFDGDGRADLSTFTPNGGNWRILGSNSGLTNVQFGLATDKTTPADFDGDGKTDIAVYRDGTWFVLRSRDGFLGMQFGSAGDIPQPADFDGDGRADLAVFRPSSGIWYWMGSASGFGGVQFGASSDRPLVGDYDGDGKADQAVYRASAGAWYINGSAVGFKAMQFGVATDRPVPADYDGDGKTDIAVYRDGAWYVQGSTMGFKAIFFGNTTDRPAPADYDGDGKADIAVYRDGMWFLMIANGESELTAIQFGAADDLPVPSSYLQ